MTDPFDAENSSFLDAIHNDDIPRPTKRWRSPTLEEVESFVDLTKRISPELLTVEEICNNSLGFYLVRHVIYPFTVLLSHMLLSVFEVPPRRR
jgi:hypothetical protein